MWWVLPEGLTCVIALRALKERSLFGEPRGQGSVELHLPGAPPESPVASPMGWPLVRLVRPRQWIKNAFVLAPLIFSATFLVPGAVVNAIVAMLFFCVASSATYVLNDLLDVENDRRHPTKRFSRPIAAGAVTVRQAHWLVAGLYGVLLVGAFAFSSSVMAGIAIYLGINILYSFRLKTMPVVDLFCVAVGFVLRIGVGALAIPVPLSSWMAITTLCLALFLAAIKRRQELNTTPGTGRLVLSSYTVALLDRYAEMSAMGAIVFYSLFTMTMRPELVVTVPVVLFGLFRYWYLVERFDAGESPTDVVWADLPLALTVACWAGLSLIALWPGPLL